MPKTLPIFYSALLLTGVNLLLRLVGTSFQVYLSGRIGAAGIGLLQLVISVNGLALVAGMAGIRTATMYLTAEALGHKQSGKVTRVLSGCFLYSIIFSGTIALLLYTFAPQIAQLWIGDIETVDALRLFAAFLPAICLCGVMCGYFTAANRIGTLAAVEVAEQLCSMTVTMVTLSLWAGNDAARACQCVILGNCSGACLTLGCLVLLRLQEKAETDRHISVRRRLMQTAIPLAAADVLKAGINTTENLMVPKRLALNTLIENPLAAFGCVSGMVFPVLMFPACILFGLADTICLKLYSNMEAGSFLKLYALLVPMLYCDALTDAMTKGLGQQTACVRYNIISSAMDVAFLYLLLPKYGMDGYFASFLITHLINFLLSLRRLLKISGVSIPFYVPVLSCSAAMASVMGASKISGDLGQCIAYCALLCSLLYLCRIIGQEDFRWIRGLVCTKK